LTLELISPSLGPGFGVNVDDIDLYLNTWRQLLVKAGLTAVVTQEPSLLIIHAEYPGLVVDS
jgi:hypothetical protein